MELSKKKCILGLGTGVVHNVTTNGKLPQIIGKYVSAGGARVRDVLYSTRVWCTCVCAQDCMPSAALLLRNNF